MARESRKRDLLGAALEAFKDSGYEGTSVTDIVDRLGMSKAAFGYHIEFKEQLLVLLVEPLLDDLEECIDSFPQRPSWPDQGRALLASYLDVLIEHRDVVIWVDGDKAVLEHPILGERLDKLNRRVRIAIRGDDRSAAARFGSAAALGALWRPLRNLTELTAVGEDEKESMLDAAMAVVATVRARRTEAPQ